MRKTLRPLFWLETSMATITGILFLITLVWRTWIELVFGVDPDKSNGSLGWLIVGALLVVTLALFTLPGLDWHRPRTTPACTQRATQEAKVKRTRRGLNPPPTDPKSAALSTQPR